MTTELAWHFVGATLRDGRPIPPDGEWLVYEGPIEMCFTGLHASTRILDALVDAPGGTICRVEVGEVDERDGDKLVARRRRILWRIEGDAILRAFARRAALSVAHLWEIPDVVRLYLETGDETLRDAASAAASAAARAAASAAASAAGRAAASAAAWAALNADLHSAVATAAGHPEDKP